MAEARNLEYFFLLSSTNLYTYMRHHYIKEQLGLEVKNSISIAEVCRRIGIRPSGGNYKTLKMKIKEFFIDTSHFTGQGWRFGSTIPVKRQRPLEEILTICSRMSSNWLRKRLLKEGIFHSKCALCNNSEWDNKPIPLELDHINGINTDNRIENLRILCPNCHAQTSNYRGRNKLSARSERDDVEYRKFREPLSHGNPEPSQVKMNNLEGAETRHGRPKKVMLKCLKCENLVKSLGRIFCSKECYQEHNSESIPKVPIILAAFKEHKSFLQVGNHFNVSDNAVRKWCEKYGITDMVKV